MSNLVSTRRQIRPVERIRNTRPINGAYCAIRQDFLTVLSQDRSKHSASKDSFWEINKSRCLAVSNSTGSLFP